MTVKIGGGDLPLSGDVEMAVAGTVLVTEVLEESDLNDFLNCKSNLRWNTDLPGLRSDNQIITAKGSVLSFIWRRTSHFRSSEYHCLRFV